MTFARVCPWSIRGADVTLLTLIAKLNLSVPYYPHCAKQTPRTLSSVVENGSVTKTLLYCSKF